MDLEHGRSSDQEKPLKKKQGNIIAIYGKKGKQFEDPG